ncbi:MAG: hypothetical protein ACRENP_04305 [Longimicrobiales bacterium]
MNADGSALTDLHVAGAAPARKIVFNRHICDYYDYGGCGPGGIGIVRVDLTGFIEITALPARAPDWRRERVNP